MWARALAAHNNVGDWQLRLTNNLVHFGLSASSLSIVRDMLVGDLNMGFFVEAHVADQIDWQIVVAGWASFD